MKVQGKAVLVLPDKEPEKTPSGIIINAAKKENVNLHTGKVVDTGWEVEEIQIGDKVFYPKKKASIIIIDDVEHHFVIEDQILIITDRNE